jgi:hypothetical protein
VFTPGNDRQRMVGTFVLLVILVVMITLLYAR